MSDITDLIKEARESIEAAHDELIRIMEAGTQTRMSIPADPSRDTDLIMVAAFDLSRKALDALEAVTVPTENRAALLELSKRPPAVSVADIEAVTEAGLSLDVPSERAEDAIAFRVADTLAYYGCRASNPKADDPHMGYHAFSEDQREHLRGKQADATAEIVRIIASERAAAKAEATQPECETGYRMQ